MHCYNLPPGLYVYSCTFNWIIKIMLFQIKFYFLFVTTFMPFIVTLIVQQTVQSTIINFNFNIKIAKNCVKETCIKPK